MASSSSKRIGYFKDLIVGVILCLTMINSLYSEESVLKHEQQLANSFEAPTTTIPQVVTIERKDSVPSSTTIPLETLTDGTKTIECSEPLIFVPNHILDHLNLQDRKIPRIVHVTSKSRCMTKPFVDNLQTWQFPDHNFYFHDDNAVDRLFQKAWPSFPHISVATRCMRPGAATIDLWRLLVLWEYGGIYTDIDNAPGPFWNETTTIIKADDDAFFVVEHVGVLSQYFMAVSPRHPLMYLAIQAVLYRLLGVDHVGKQYIPQVTGPGALKMAFRSFMRAQDSEAYGKVKEGKYMGVGRRSVTVAGSKKTSWQIVTRGSLPGVDKIGGYKQMNMKHFGKIAKKKFNESCFVHMYNLEYLADQINMTNW